MDSGYKVQLIFRKEAFEAASAPRLINVRNVVDAYDLWDKAIYQEHAQAILDRYKATSQSTCWNVVHDEHLGHRRDGILRRTLEELEMPPDPSLGVICITGNPRVADSRAFMLELDLGLGAHGGITHRYPLPNFPHTWMLVKVSDERTLSSFARESRRSQTRGGKEYRFLGELHTDENVGQGELAFDDACRLVRMPCKKVDIAYKSNFKDPDQEKAEHAWFDTIQELRSKMGQDEI